MNEQYFESVSDCSTLQNDYISNFIIITNILIWDNCFFLWQIEEIGLDSQFFSSVFPGYVQPSLQVKLWVWLNGRHELGLSTVCNLSVN
jgi:hypothetical protein